MQLCLNFIIQFAMYSLKFRREAFLLQNKIVCLHPVNKTEKVQNTKKKEEKYEEKDIKFSENKLNAINGVYVNLIRSYELPATDVSSCETYKQLKQLRKWHKIISRCYFEYNSSDIYLLSRFSIYSHTHTHSYNIIEILCITETLAYTNPESRGTTN